MIIDIHTHTFPAKIAAQTLEKLSGASHTTPFTDGTTDGLIAAMRKSGVDLSVICPVATNPRQVEKVNDASKKICDTLYAEGLLSFGCMHPDYEDPYKELARIKDLGLKGIKLHPVYQGVDFDDPKTLRILAACRDLDLIVITHAGPDIGFPGVDHVSPQMVRHALAEVGDFKLILAHMGGWKVWDKVPEYLADTCVYLDTAFSTGVLSPKDDHWSEEELTMLNPDQFMDMVRAFGPDRLIFGTDSPWSRQDESLAFLRDLPLSGEDLDKILGGNAAKLLNLT